MDSALRPMSTSQVLDRTFTLYKQNFLLFAGIAALPPALLLLGRLMILSAGASTKTGGNLTLQITAVVAAVSAGLVLALLWLIGYALATGASVYAVSRVHLGHVTSIAESYRMVRPYAGRVLGIVALVFLAVGGVTGLALAALLVPIVITASRHAAGPAAFAGFGLLLLILAPAVLVIVLYLSAKLSLSVPACVMERLGVIDSLKRSWKLTQGSVLRLILITFLAAIISFAVSAVLSIPYFIGIALSVAKKDPSALLPFMIWEYAADFVARSLAFPIATIAVSLIYYDERVRKEAFDLQLMMEAVAQHQPEMMETQSAPGSIG